MKDSDRLATTVAVVAGAWLAAKALRWACAWAETSRPARGPFDVRVHLPVLVEPRHIVRLSDVTP